MSTANPTQRNASAALSTSPAEADGAASAGAAEARRPEVSQRPDSPTAAGHAEEAEIVTIRPDASIMTKQRLPNFVGVSKATAGAGGISMNLVVIPPGGAAEPHFHRGFETAIFLLEGRVETRYGKGLAKSVIHQAGDFLFIPADLPHQPVNLSATEPARAIVARNDASEQESVVPYDPAADN
ncbi:MAG TPA: cupin domain-containing protein [Paracoccaceae bacterium]|nr:cupin domain-containing protein [Paracoccaceae bacterium]